MKVCCRCKQQKPYPEFSKLARAKDGYRYMCKECRRDESKQYRLKNKEKIKEYSRAYYRDNKEEHTKRCLDWQRRNPEKVKDALKKYKKIHSGKVNALNAKRVAEKKSATPSWADLGNISVYYEFAKFFEATTFGKKYHVDHIIPMKGKSVCGLHVENNLQILPAEVNIRKSNKLQEDTF